MTKDELTPVPLTHDWDAKQWDWPLQHHDGVVRVTNTKEKFEVGLECCFFTPKEIDVKVAGGEVVIHCLHEERTDSHGTVKREIHRAYHLPTDVDPKKIRSHLNSKGVLLITADKH